MLGQLQNLLGVASSDVELLLGAVSLLIGVILLGISGNLRGRNWLFWLGWLFVIAGSGALLLGFIHGTHSGPAGLAPGQ